MAYPGSYPSPAFGQQCSGFPQMPGTGVDGAMDYGAVPPQSMFGGAQMAQKGPFVRAPRRRMNVVPLFLCLFLPWICFLAAYVPMAFRIHYDQPALCYLIVACVACAVLVASWVAITSRWRTFHTQQPEREPSWIIFLAVSMFVALVMGIVMGNGNYTANMQQYFDMMNLNNYTDINPSRMRGQQMMDAGTIQFAPETKLDITKSMGFKNVNIYCVAPITLGADPLPTYDFWAVGVNCCSGNQANFHCGSWNSPHANGGLRLMSDGDRAFYRLAVQQAEAMYKIKAVHPLFFEWVADPMKRVEGWRSTGGSQALVWIASYFVAQAFLVLVAAVVFSKLGQF